MPFVEGESLRAKLAREGELPVAEAVQDPARGRGRARLRPPERRRPPRHQARQRPALGRPRGGHRLRRRQGGERVERRRPRSPRSASRSARRPTWRRSRPRPIRTSTIGPTSTPSARWPTRCSPGGTPFTAPTPQAHARGAHHPGAGAGRAVPARRVRRRSTRVLMRCLEKRAADRWQSAAELLGQLEAASHAERRASRRSRHHARRLERHRGGHPAEPPGAGRRCSSPSPRWRCSASCTCWSASSGCPTGCSSAPSCCSLIGLPIMLVTGHLERRRALARASGRVHDTPSAGIAAAGSPGARRSAAACIAFAALGVAAVGLHGDAAPRDRAGGHAGRLGPAQRAGPAGRGRLREPDRGLQPGRLDHRGLPDRSRPVARDQDPEHRRSRATRSPACSATPTTPVTPAVARELAAREGAKAVVAGEISALGKSYVLSARILSAADGSELVALRETADGRRRHRGRARPALRPRARADRRVAQDAFAAASRWTR